MLKLLVVFTLLAGTFALPAQYPQQQYRQPQQQQYSQPQQQQYRQPQQPQYQKPNPMQAALAQRRPIPAPVAGFGGPGFGSVGGPLLASSMPVPGLIGGFGGQFNPGMGGIGGIGGFGGGFGGMGSIDPLGAVYGGPFKGPFAEADGGPWAGPFRTNSNNINPRGGRG